MSKKIIPIIMAGGDGKRFKGSTHKLLTQIGKFKTIDYVLNLANKINKHNFCITSSHINNYIKEKHPKTNRILQKKPLGTAHALSLVKNKIDKTSDIIILYGDMPLLKYSTLKLMINEYYKNNIPLLLYFKSKKKLDFGIVNLLNNKVTSIVEYKYFSKSDLLKNKYKFKNYNGGVIIINYSSLKKLINKIKLDKKYNQKLLTDLFNIAYKNNLFFEAFLTKKNQEMIGLNTKKNYTEIIKQI
jgi:bifunctional UDP-N-acetylglucosamine pyrophosphorylase/glucosamine-1-phosphate N-acetyltransferase